MFFTSCCVIVLPPTRYGLSPEMLVMSAPDHPDRIDARVLVEAAVLDGQDRVAPRAAGSACRRTWRRFSRSPLISEVSSGGSSVTASRRAAVHHVEPLEAFGAGGRRRGAGLRHGRLAERRADGLAGERRPSAGTSVTVCADTANSPAPLGRGRSRVAEVVEPIDQLPLAERLPAAQFHRPRVDARQHPLALAVQPRVDQAREPDVVVAEERRERRWPGARGRRRGSIQRGAPAAGASARCSRGTLRTTVRYGIE